MIIAMNLPTKSDSHKGSHKETSNWFY